MASSTIRHINNCDINNCDINTAGFTNRHINNRDINTGFDHYTWRHQQPDTSTTVTSTQLASSTDTSTAVTSTQALIITCGFINNQTHPHLHHHKHDR
ncbi:hypothetical protein ACOMHN_020847 [Nucella lapillus]